MIFHLTSQKEWQQAQSTGSYLPAGFTADGFIHCSDHYQIEMTANRFYLDAEDHIILEIDDERLSSPLVYENLEGGQMLFPTFMGLSIWMRSPVLLGLFAIGRAIGSCPWQTTQPVGPGYRDTLRDTRTHFPYSHAGQPHV